MLLPVWVGPGCSLDRPGRGGSDTVPVVDGMTGTAAIATNGLSKSFGETAALVDLDLVVPPGCILAYLGPNGAGKTTTIRVLVGLVRPSSGRASVLGHDVVSERREVQRSVGYLPGEFVPYRDLSGGQYLDHLASLRGGVQRSSIDDLAARFELDLSRRVGSLSHGNRQKLGIVQACMHDPEVLVLDEPSQGLDPLMQNVLLDLLRERRDAGTTVFLSSHVLSEVEQVADAVAIIRQGRLVSVSDVSEIEARARRRVELTFVDPSTAPFEALGEQPNVVELVVEGPRADLVVEGSMAELLRIAAPAGIERVVASETDLEDLFISFYRGE